MMSRYGKYFTQLPMKQTEWPCEDEYGNTLPPEQPIRRCTP